MNDKRRIPITIKLANASSKEIGQTKGACLQSGSRLFAFHTEFFNDELLGIVQFVILMVARP
jgi:hypothetical protein